MSVNCLQKCQWTVFKNRVGELFCRWTVLFPFSNCEQGSCTCLFFSIDTVPQWILNCKREAGWTDPYGPKKTAIQAHQAFCQHYSSWAISCGPLSSELSQSDAAYSSLGRTVFLGAKFLQKGTKCLSCFGRNFWNVLTPIHVISDGYTKVFCPTEHSQSFLNVLVALEEISEMCWRQSMLSVMGIPRYFARLNILKVFWMS